MLLAAAAASSVSAVAVTSQHIPSTTHNARVHYQHIIAPIILSSTCSNNIMLSTKASSSRNKNKEEEKNHITLTTASSMFTHRSSVCILCTEPHIYHDGSHALIFHLQFYAPEVLTRALKKESICTHKVYFRKLRALAQYIGPRCYVRTFTNI